MWSVLLSVDCFGRDGYIISRALMLFSPFFVSWHVLVMRAVLWSSAPHRSRHRPNKTVPPGHDGSDFFIDFHSISSHLSAACLLADLLFATRLPSYPYRPRSSPRYPRHGGRGGHGCDTADVGWLSCLPRVVMDGDGRQQWRNDCDVVIA